LLAQAALSSLSLPKLEETHYSARALLTGSLILGLLSIFFTCVQQRELGRYGRPKEIRAWLSSKKEQGDKVQSSIIAHQLLQAPFEMLGVSVTMFVAGLGIYEGSAFTRKVGLNTTNGVPVSNLGVLVPFVVGTVFGWSVLGFLTGRKEAEDHVQGELEPATRDAPTANTVSGTAASANVQLPST
jgi:hypothetical protein